MNDVLIVMTKKIILEEMRITKSLIKMKKIHFLQQNVVTFHY